jgi:hypothetical protein
VCGKAAVPDCCPEQSRPPDCSLAGSADHTCLIRQLQTAAVSGLHSSATLQPQASFSSMQTRASMIHLIAALAAVCSTAVRPLDSSSDWPLEALAAIEASCDGCFDPVAAFEQLCSMSRQQICKRVVSACTDDLPDAPAAHSLTHNECRGDTYDQLCQVAGHAWLPR